MFDIASLFYFQTPRTFDNSVRPIMLAIVRGSCFVYQEQRKE